MSAIQKIAKSTLAIRKALSGRMELIWTKKIFLIPIILGISVFLLIVGPRVLDPEYLGWLEIDNDPLMGYMGWSFYRFSDWHLPLGLNPKYGLDVASSIVYSDSVTLLAILLKPFSGALPYSFQYFGWWTLICFVFQGYFGWLLTSLFNPSIVFRIFATTCFLFIPIMLDRIGMHAGLVAQFTILAAFYLNFTPLSKNQTLYWVLLIFISTLIHFYLLFFVICIWTAGLLDSAILKKTISYAGGLKQSLVCMLTLALTMWQAGYFTIPTASAGDWGYGTWSMNLLSFFNGIGWTYILPPIPGVNALGNRFQFPGIGIYILIIFALYKFPSSWSVIKPIFHKNIFLILLLISFYIFAITNYINIGPLSFHFNLPKFIITFCNSLRASDRMFWPILYIIIIGSLAIISKAYKKRNALLIIIIASFVQVIDTSAGWIPLHKRINSYSQTLTELPLKDHFWEVASKKYQKILLINDGNNTQEENWRVFSRYALMNNMDSSAAVFARVNMAKVQEMVSHFRSSQLMSDSLYILSDYELPRYITKLDPHRDLLAKIDGFNVIAPNWKGCHECPSSSHRVYGPATHSGTPITFSDNTRTSKSFLIDGWSPITEDWGIWSIAPEARITIPIPTSDTPKHIKLSVRAFVNSLNPSQNIEIYENGKFLKAINLKKFEGNELVIPINSQIISRGYVDLVFKFNTPRSPKELGIGEDERALSIGLKSALFEK